eukprot:6096679-Pleurochrysis_carterae.AAC.1
MSMSGKGLGEDVRDVVRRCGSCAPRYTRAPRTRAPSDRNGQRVAIVGRICAPSSAPLLRCCRRAAEWDVVEHVPSLRAVCVDR